MRMTTNLSRRFPATLAGLLLLAGCASLAPRATAPVPPPSAAGYPMAADSLAWDEDEDEGEGERGTPISIEYNLRMEADEQGPPRVWQLLRAQAQRKAIAARSAPATLEKAAGLQPAQWQALGPSNVGGRVRALAFDPRDPARLLAGTASGGLWISPDGGRTWGANNDFMPNLSVTTLVFDPSNPAVVYAGTGEASAGLVGVGVFKSADGGNTWRHLDATNPDANADWRFVNRLAIDPGQPDVLLAGVTNASLAGGAIYRSVDRGASWARVAPLKALDVGFDPSNPANAVAGLDDGTIAYSRDAGATWARSAPLVPSPSGRQNTARAEIAFARTQPGLVYASVDNAKGEVWRSQDDGATWEFASNPAHLGVQGDYDNAIWVDPTDASHVVVAGLDVYESRDGGATFAQVSDWRRAPRSPHADHHALVSPPDFGPSNPALYDGNDGGVYKAANVYALAGGTQGTGWENMNQGLAVTQFYGGAGTTAAGGRIYGGTQDNGSLVLFAGAWRMYRGGDGGVAAVDPVSDVVAYGEYVYLALHRTLNGGSDSSYICQGITEAMPPDASGNTYCGSGATKKANFIAPFVLDPNDASRMYAGASSLWVTDDVKAVAPAWRSIKPPVAFAADDFINAIAVQPGNGNVVWVGHDKGEVYRTANALAAAPQWRQVGVGTLPARLVQRITIDPANPDHVIVAFTGFVPGNVWQTRDGGATWQSITGNLPDAPVFDVKIHPAVPGWLYAATSVGVFTSQDGGATWSTTNEGPANIRVRELFWIDASTLGAATYGRGMYKAAVASGGPPSYQDLWWGGTAENGWGVSIAQHGDRIFAVLYVYDAAGRPMWVVMPSGTWNAGYTDFTGPVYIPSGAPFSAYDASRLAMGAAAGNVTLHFASLASGTLSYTIQGESGSKPLSRLPFGPPDSTPVASYGDLWWGGIAQNGWGLSINQQYRTLFAVWYTYDEAGRNVWYVLPGGQWTSETSFAGSAYRANGSAWLGRPYDASAFRTTPIGSITFSFTDPGHATMAYTIDGISQSKALERLQF
jgi:photosystem II stability/assembly factor-like uncharacterized protein